MEISNDGRDECDETKLHMGHSWTTKRKENNLMQVGVYGKCKPDGSVEIHSNNVHTHLLW